MFVPSLTAGQPGVSPVRSLFSTPLATPLAAFVYLTHDGGLRPPSFVLGTLSLPGPCPDAARPSVHACVLGRGGAGHSGRAWRCLPSSETMLSFGSPTPPVMSRPVSAS